MIFCLLIGGFILEKNKSSLDNYTMILNHILVIMVSFGAGTVKMLVDGKTDIWLYIGIFLTFALAVGYSIIFILKIK